MPSSFMLRHTYRTARELKLPPGFAENDGVAAARLVVDDDRRPQRCELSAHTRDVRPQRLFRQLPVVPGLDKQAVRADEVRRAAHQHHEQLKLALREGNRAIAIDNGAKFMVDVETLQPPLTLVPEPEPTPVTIELAGDDRDVVVDLAVARRLGHSLELVREAAEQFLVETDHLAIDGNPVPNIARERGVRVLTLEETIRFYRSGVQNGRRRFLRGDRTKNRISGRLRV